MLGDVLRAFLTCSIYALSETSRTDLLSLLPFHLSDPPFPFPSPHTTLASHPRRSRPSTSTSAARSGAMPAPSPRRPRVRLPFLLLRDFPPRLTVSLSLLPPAAALAAAVQTSLAAKVATDADYAILEKRTVSLAPASFSTSRLSVYPVSYLHPPPSLTAIALIPPLLFPLVPSNPSSNPFRPILPHRRCPPPPPPSPASAPGAPSSLASPATAPRSSPLLHLLRLLSPPLPSPSLPLSPFLPLTKQRLMRQPFPSLACLP